jgi:CTP synthase (UTP-ammonia lyase)
MRLKIGIIGDFDARPSHLATQAALEHSISTLGLSGGWEWIPTETLLASEPVRELSKFDRLLGAPGSPFKSFEGALRGIQTARENQILFLGTCGGAQHAILEIARNLLGENDAHHGELNPIASNLWITPMGCSMRDLENRIKLIPYTIAHGVYGDGPVNERFRCSYGLDPAREKALGHQGLQVTGRDGKGQAVLFELRDHPFFVGTLFQPQLSSTQEFPHPLINRFLSM